MFHGITRGDHCRSQFMKIITGRSSHQVHIIDPMRALIDPDNSNHIFVSTWGGGLLEYENNNLIKQYNESNSPLQTIIPGQPYVRICGLAMDKSKNLWMTQTEVQGSIKVLKPDGTWIVNPVTIRCSDNRRYYNYQNRT